MKVKENRRGQFAPLLATVLVCLLTLPVVSNAQLQTTTDISGSVADEKGASIGSATIELTNQNTGAKQSTATNSAGFYSFPSLRPGTYSLSFSKTGFQTTLVTDRVADVAQPARVNVTLKVGTVMEVVQVSGAGAELLDTASAELSGTISDNMVQNLPLNGRDVYDLASLTPGSSSQGALGPQKSSSAMQISFAQTSLNLSSGSAAGLYVTSGVMASGNRDSATNISIDGSNVQSALYGQAEQLQSVSDVKEVKVESGIMNPEFGFGATAVNIITKSGTNSLHGEVFEYLRNDNLDATNYFTKLVNQANPEYKVNEFGGSVGGPIIRNKLHFFANYEGLRLVQSTTASAAVPTATMHTGDFSAASLANGTSPVIYNPFQYDPATGLRQPFPDNQIPLGPTTLCSPRPTCVDPTALAMLAYTPPPNTVVDGIPTLAGTQATTVLSNQYTGRIDWDVSSKDQIFSRYTFYQTHATAGGLMTLQGSTNPYGTRNPTISWTRVFSPSFLNNLTVSYTRLNWGTARRTDVGDVAETIGIRNTSNNPGSPGFSIADYTLNQSLYTDAYTLENTYQLKDNVSIVRGKHILKFGFEGNKRQLVFSIAGTDKGGWTYNSPLYTTACPLGNTTCQAAATAAGDLAGGSAFADFLLGVPPSELTLRLEGSLSKGIRQYLGGYAQDSWQISSKLTMNYGLRYEYWSPWLSPGRIVARWDGATGQVVYALKNPLDYLNPATDYGRNAPLTPGEVATGYTTGKKDFAPRLGLAYLLTPNTTLRAGAGIFFDGNGNQEQIAEEREGVGPFGLLLDQFDTGTSQAPTTFMSQQFPVPPPTAIAAPSLTNPPSVRVMGSKFYPTPTINEWSASIQRRIGTGWSVEVNYFGSRTVHQQQWSDQNPASLPQGALANATLQQRRIFPDWGSVGSWVDIGWAKYNALTTTLRAPRWRGLSALSWFTWSKDKTSSAEGYSDYGNVDPRIFDIWAGPSLLNPDLRNVNTFDYELPFGKHRKLAMTGPLDWIVGGWNVSGTLQFSQGGHQSVYGQDTSATGQPFPMPNEVCDPNNVPGGKTRLEWFNTSCYQTPAFGTFGTAKLGSFREPGINNWNASFAKSFPLFGSEERRIEFHAAFFNMFNHTQWGYVTNSMTSSTFGRVQDAHEPRQIQLALKVLF